MKNSSYGEIKSAKEKKVTELMEKCGLFFAFNDEQFNENKTPLEQGEKYVHIGAGGYMPKSKVALFESEMKKINSWKAKEVKKSKQEETEILYELNNYECFYTGDIEDALPALLPNYSIEKITAVFNFHQRNQ